MLLISVIEIAVSQTQSNETVLIETTFGNMKVKLFNETKLHKANFLKLVNEHFYDSLLFHRVIEGFMIQGGDPYSKHADAFKLLGDSDLHYTIPAEFNKNLFHKKCGSCSFLFFFFHLLQLRVTPLIHRPHLALKPQGHST